MMNTSNLSKIYKHGLDETLALKDINISINKGDKVLIKGVSGAGKSSLINILGFLDFDFSGEYIFNKQSYKNLSSNEIAKIRNKEFGYIFQEYALIENESVIENIRVPLLYSNIISKNHDIKITDLLQKLELTEQKNKKVKHLSGGQRQRVAIARALINEPNVIIADEPTGSLNKDLKKDMLNILFDYVKDNKTLILITHDFEYIDEDYFKIIHLENGFLKSNK